MNTTQALQGAVEMLQKIAKGGSYNRVEYIERLMAYEAALANTQRDHLEDEQKRAAEMSLHSGTRHYPKWAYLEKV